MAKMRPLSHVSEQTQIPKFSMQDPTRPNIVEISIPATAVESFMNAVNDQAQQLLLKFAKPQAGNRLEIKKTEHQNEGDAFKKITMEALYEQVSCTRHKR